MSTCFFTLYDAVINAVLSFETYEDTKKFTNTQL